MLNQTLQMSLLGELAITWPLTVDGEKLTRQELALFIYLVCQSRPQTREHLCDLLWEDRPVVQARSNLRTLLTRSRPLLGDLLRIDRESVAFNFDTPHWVDVIEFRQQIFQNAQSLSQQRSHQENATRRLTKALQLYRGDFLANFSVRHANHFDRWIMQEQLQLRQQMVEGLQALVQTYLNCADYVVGLPWVRRLLELNPHDEQFHAYYMQMLVGARQLDVALLHYETQRRKLEIEFGERPGEKLLRLYDIIRSGNVALALQRQEGDPRQLLAEPPTITVAPVASGPVPTANGVPFRRSLPLPMTPLLGRAAQLAKLRHLLRQPMQRLVTLTGLAGIGKTHLALSVAQELQAEFADGVIYVPLPAVDIPTHTPTSMDDDYAVSATFNGVAPLRQQKQHFWQTLAAALPLPHQVAISDESQMFEVAVLNFLARRELLLVIDNVENLLPMAGLIETIVEADHEVTVLAIARERLPLRSETAVILDGLAVANSSDWRLADYLQASSQQRAEHFAALHLFVEQVQSYLGELTLTEEWFAQAAHICRLVDGHPLALELAAAWSPHFTVGEIAAAIEHDLGFLQDERRQVVNGHNSLIGLLAALWQQLPPAQQTVCAKLSSFPGDFDRAAAAESAGATPAILATLVRKALLKLTGVGRYQLSPLLRRFIKDCLATG